MLTRVFKIESCLLPVSHDGNVICSSSFLRSVKVTNPHLFGLLLNDLDFNNPRKFALRTPTHTFVVWNDSTYKLPQFSSQCSCHCPFQPPSSSTFWSKKLCYAKSIIAFNYYCSQNNVGNALMRV